MHSWFTNVIVISILTFKIMGGGVSRPNRYSYEHRYLNLSKDNHVNPCSHFPALYHDQSPEDLRGSRSVLLLSYPGGAYASLGGEVSRLLGPRRCRRLDILAALLLVRAGTLAALHPRAAPGHRATYSSRGPSHRRVSFRNFSIPILFYYHLSYD